MSIDDDLASDAQRRPTVSGDGGVRAVLRRGPRTAPHATDHVPLCLRLGINPTAPGAEFIPHIYDGDDATTVAAFLTAQDLIRASEAGLVDATDAEAVMEFLSKTAMPAAATSLISDHVERARELDNMAAHRADRGIELAADSEEATNAKLAVPTTPAESTRLPGISNAQNRDLLNRNRIQASLRDAAGDHEHHRGPVPPSVRVSGLTLLSGAESYLLLQRFANFSVYSPGSWVVLGLLTSLLAFVTHWLTVHAGEAIAAHRELDDGNRALTRVSLDATDTYTTGGTT